MRKIIALALIGIFLVGCSSQNIDQSILDKLNALNEPYTVVEDTYTCTDILDKSLIQPYFDLIKSEYGIDMRYHNYEIFKYKQGKFYFSTAMYYLNGSDRFYFDNSKLTDLSLCYETEEDKLKVKKFLKLLNFPSDIEPTDEGQSIDIDGVEYTYEVSYGRLNIYTREIDYKEVDLSIKDKIIGMIPNLNKIPYSNFNTLDEYEIELYYSSDEELQDITLYSPGNLKIGYNKLEDYVNLAYCFDISHSEGTRDLDVARYMLKGYVLEKKGKDTYKVKDKEIYVNLHDYDNTDFSIEYKGVRWQ